MCCGQRCAPIVVVVAIVMVVAIVVVDCIVSPEAIVVDKRDLANIPTRGFAMI